MNESEIIQAYEDIKANVTAMAMIIRCEEMPGILASARAGDEDARIRLNAVGNVVPSIEAGGHNCVLCGHPVRITNLAAMIFVSKKIEPGADALWSLVCGDCDGPDPASLTKKVMDQMGFRRIDHDAGNA